MQRAVIGHKREKGPIDLKSEGSDGAAPWFDSLGADKKVERFVKTYYRV